jgi:hypothetical protein
VQYTHYGATLGDFDDVAMSIVDDKSDQMHEERLYVDDYHVSR